MNYEDALNKIQGHGRFNIYLTLILSIMAFLSSLDMNSVPFFAYSPTFKCNISAGNFNNFTWTTDQCRGTYLDDLKQTTIFECTNWIFDKSVMKRSLVSEFSLVCSKKNLATIYESLFVVGIAVGSFTGILGDIIGRKKLIMLACSFEIIINVFVPFFPNVWMLLVCRFLGGFALCKLYQAISILMEILPINKRSFYGNNYWVFWVLGYMGAPIVAFLVRDWRYMKMIISLPFLCYILLYFVPESPRWLSLKGRHDEAKKMLVYIGRHNGVKLTEQYFDDLKPEKADSKGGPMDLVKYPVMRLKMLVAIVAHSTLALSYIGMTFNSTFLTNNIFLNVFIQGCIEIFTGPAGWILSSRLSRKTAVLLLHVFTAATLLASGFLGRLTLAQNVSKAVLGSLAKFSITAVYCIIDMYLPEIFPTVVRNLGFFVVIGIGNGVGILAPWINVLDKNLAIPFLSSSFYSLMNLMSGLLVFFLLPESRGCPLPETIKEGEMLKRDNERQYSANIAAQKPKSKEIELSSSQ